MEYLQGHIGEGAVLVGGDGRLLNQMAAELLLRVFSANGMLRVLLSQRLVLSPAVAINSLLLSSENVKAAIVLTAGGYPGGVRNGFFGVKILFSRVDTLGRKTVQTVDENGWNDILQRMTDRSRVQIAKSRLPLLPSSPNKAFGDLLKTQIETVDVISPYLVALGEEFQLERIKKFIDKFGLLVAIDCKSGIGSSLLLAKNAAGKSLLSAIGCDEEACLLNGRPLSDFGGLSPNSLPEDSPQTLELFGLSEATDLSSSIPENGSPSYCRILTVFSM